MECNKLNNIPAPPANRATIELVKRLALEGKLNLSLQTFPGNKLAPMTGDSTAGLEDEQGEQAAPQQQEQQEQQEQQQEQQQQEQQQQQEDSEMTDANEEQPAGEAEVIELVEDEGDFACTLCAAQGFERSFAEARDLHHHLRVTHHQRVQGMMGRAARAAVTQYLWVARTATDPKLSRR